MMSSNETKIKSYQTEKTKSDANKQLLIILSTTTINRKLIISFSNKFYS